MPPLPPPSLVPVHYFQPDHATGHASFTLVRLRGETVPVPYMLLPHRKDYYLLFFVQHTRGRHWVDLTPYAHQDNTLYFTNPTQILVNEELAPAWGTYLGFTREFLAVQPNAALRELPLLRNPRQGHALRLSAADVPLVEQVLSNLEAELHRPGPWQLALLSAHLTVLLTYLSRLYTEQLPGPTPSPTQRVLSAFQAQVEQHFRELHEVSAYAARLQLPAKQLSAVVKAHSGKPAIKHVHERLVLEARRLLVYSDQSLKEIAFALGFSEASYFSRFFKRETGLPPAEYRARGANRKMS
ncbi:helix-turn-helix transcriptional regulator [Hymenobacter sp. YC55]|uniref:AraC family transcriptional regulator n=1 Tax=Hymenobacter sp. YC55 TaxID=3034019 RepID=UPI0023FA2BB7|nr:helix-turn-helix transcriptional regulator [Hymenobacter sp. YC55]MDF7815768.1 helix-turn-helix domain-containing protein [Hymenobacter sp. YC55]